MISRTDPMIWGAKKNEEKDTKKRKPQLDFRFLFYSLKSAQREHFVLFVVPDPDIMSWLGEGFPRYVEPAGASQQLVGVRAGAEEVDQALELSRVFGADVGSLAQYVLRVLDASDESVNARVAVAAVDDDRANQLACGLQQILATILQVKHDLHRGQVVGILLQVEKLRENKVLRQSNVIELCVFH